VLAFSTACSAALIVSVLHQDCDDGSVLGPDSRSSSSLTISCVLKLAKVFPEVAQLPLKVTGLIPHLQDTPTHRRAENGVRAVMR